MNLIFINIRIEFITGAVNMVKNTAEATGCPRLQGESLVALLNCHAFKLPYKDVCLWPSVCTALRQ